MPPKPQRVRSGWLHSKLQNRYESLLCQVNPVLFPFFFFRTLCDSALSPLSDTCEFADHGGAAAGRAAVRTESHHSVHDCLSVWRGTKLELSAGTERRGAAWIKKSEQQTEKWDDGSTFKGHSAPLFCSLMNVLFFLSDLMYLYHSVPHPPPPGPPFLQTLVVKSSHLGSLRLCAIITGLVLVFTWCCLVLQLSL